MFTGWSIHALDAKGRLAVPTRFRDALREDAGEERLVITASDNCLVAYPYSEWNAIAERVSKLSKVDPRVQAFRRYFISGASDQVLDKQGRALIPPALREVAGLDSQVFLVGMQGNFEIWDKDRYQAERERIRQSFGDLSSFMAELGV